MAELEFGGLKFTGGKMFAVLTALSTLGGGAWAGFEIYADYMDMKEIIQNIDVGAIEARNDVIETKLVEAIDYTRDIKNGLRDDIIKLEQNIDRMEDKVDESETRIKNTQMNIENVLESVRNEMNELQKDVTASIREVENAIRESEKDVRNVMKETVADLENKMDKLESDTREKIQEALDNPLSK